MLNSVPGDFKMQTQKPCSKSLMFIPYHPIILLSEHLISVFCVHLSTFYSTNAEIILQNSIISCPNVGHKPRDTSAGINIKLAVSNLQKHKLKFSILE